MSAANTGGPAFPCLPPVGPDGTAAVGYPCVSEGMTLRDYFAAKAMTSLILLVDDGHNNIFGNEADIAALAYEQADHMLDAREGEQ